MLTRDNAIMRRCIWTCMAINGDVIHTPVFRLRTRNWEQSRYKESSRCYKTGLTLMSSAHNIVARHAPAKGKRSSTFLAASKFNENSNIYIECVKQIFSKILLFW